VRYKNAGFPNVDLQYFTQIVSGIHRQGHRKGIGTIEGAAMTEELKTAWENAYSRQPQNPSGLHYIGTVERGGREYIFYKDTQGCYWFDCYTKEDKKRIRKKPVRW